MRTYVIAAALFVSLNALAEPVPDTYKLQPGDLLMVSVWKEPELSSDLLIRPDGAISMPLAGSMDAAGHTVEELRKEIDLRLRRFIPDPSVAVMVKQTQGNQIFVIGKVNKPGQYPLNRPVDVMQALSIAGGATPFAAINDIRILRRVDGEEKSISFHYGEVEHGHRLQQNMLLQSGDTVVVP
jgi:polysaccharide export outer membrane protein